MLTSADDSKNPPRPVCKATRGRSLTSASPAISRPSRWSHPLFTPTPSPSHPSTTPRARSVEPTPPSLQGHQRPVSDISLTCHLTAIKMVSSSVHTNPQPFPPKHHPSCMLSVDSPVSCPTCRHYRTASADRADSWPGIFPSWSAAPLTCQICYAPS